MNVPAFSYQTTLDDTRGLSPCDFPFVTLLTRYSNRQAVALAHADVSGENREGVRIFLRLLRESGEKIACTQPNRLKKMPSTQN